jgi:hypothetical protein
MFWKPAYHNDDNFLKHRKKRPSGGSTVSSAADSMSTGRAVLFGGKIYVDLYSR